MSVVLKPFMWSPDGHTTIWQEIGKLAGYGAHEIGLLAEGFIGHEAPKEPVVPVTPAVPVVPAAPEPAPATSEPEPAPEPVVTPAPAAPAAKAKTAAK